MDKVIRQLTGEDLPHLATMETGIEEDYVIRVFERISSGNNRLYGLFWNGQLVSVGGYSIFAKRYAMLGRMRSDLRFRGNALSTTLMSAVMEEAFKLEDIEWVGANTQEENSSARRVLQKIGMTEHSMTHGAITKNVSMLETGAAFWREVQSLEHKKQWTNRLYVEPETVFPYECYYPFPASVDLFTDDNLKEWTFYENETATRVLILKQDIKKHHYLQAIYPWDDFTEQPGLWETISSAYRKMSAEVEEESYIWMDLTKEQAQSLPDGHSFKLPSPWILYGISREALEAEKGA